MPEYLNIFVKYQESVKDEDIIYIYPVYYLELDRFAFAFNIKSKSKEDHTLILIQRLANNRATPFRTI